VAEPVVCADIGSTFTKAALVDVVDGRLLATAEHPTTLATDVLDGVDHCVARLAEVDPSARDAEVLACSSAGGGLRIAVVGNEELVTAEAGRRVALSSGGRVVHVSAGGVDPARLQADRPDILLLVGGTDGGNAEVLLRCARGLAGWTGPVVIAGNVEARDEAGAILAAAGTSYVLADNVVPRIGELAPGSARRAIRAVFLRHVIGGKHLSQRPELAAVVRAATPDAVHGAVELLARGLDDHQPGVGDAVVVDVGGATTDVYSAVEGDREGLDRDGIGRDVVGAAAVSRTVEGDLGMRWSAETTVEEAVASGLMVPDERLRRAAERRRADPAYLPDGPGEAQTDAELAALAAAVALRRHAGRAQVRFDPTAGAGRRIVERSGTDLREVSLLVGSGGVLRHTKAAADRLLDHLDGSGGWQLPHRPRVVVDADYVLAPAGLLAERHPEAAYLLLGALRG
jgi:uncharacterized protein (TIGR01319 family)